MIKPLVLILGLFALMGCNENRSISYYRYGGMHHYNPSYNGEYSQIAFIKDVSNDQGESPGKMVKIDDGEKVLVMQSGQITPDSLMIDAAGELFETVPISGIPAKDQMPTLSLQHAASAGGIHKIVGYWGNIETTGEDMISISLQAIVADVSRGVWSHYTVSSDTQKVAFAFFDKPKADDQQIVSLKKQAYSRLLKSVMSKP